MTLATLTLWIIGPAMLIAGLRVALFNLYDDWLAARQARNRVIPALAPDSAGDVRQQIDEAARFLRRWAAVAKCNRKKGPKGQFT